MSTFNTEVEIIIHGRACVLDCEVEYDYEPAGGDGWNEPAYPERSTVCAVKVNGMEMLPILSENVIKGLEADCCEYEAEEREYRKSEAADWKREEMRV